MSHYKVYPKDQEPIHAATAKRMVAYSETNDPYADLEFVMFQWMIAKNEENAVH